MAESIHGVVVSRNGGGIVIQQSGGPPGPPGPPGSGLVESVNGHTGVVVISQADISGLVGLLTDLRTDVDAAPLADDLANEIQARADGDADRQLTSEQGQANGYPDLDASGQVPAAQLSISSGLSLQGTWNATTNTPTLVDGTGTEGYYYICNVPGARNLGSGSLTFADGDRVLYTGAIWEKVSTSTAVSSVNTYTGAVTLVKGDVGLGNVDNIADANKPVSSAQQTALDGKQTIAGAKDAANGYAGLDSTARLPSAIRSYRGAWNAATNSPSLAGGTGTSGDWYWVQFPGTQNVGAGSIDFATNDVVFYNGTVWIKLATSGTLDSDLTAIAALATTSFGRSLLTQADAVAARATLGVGAGGTTALDINISTTDRILGLTDLGKFWGMDAATAKAYTIPSFAAVAHPVGTEFPYLARLGAGGLSIKPALYKDEVLADSPSLYWRLGETTGTNANDETALNHDGTYIGTPTKGVAGPLATAEPSGAFATAVDLNGTTQYITATAGTPYSPFAIGGVRTFEGWAWRDAAADNDVLFGSNHATAFAQLRIDTDGTVRFDPNAATGGDVTWTGANAWSGIGQWVYWVLVVDASAANTAILYLNGASQGSKSVTWDYDAAAGTFKIGSMGGGVSSPFDGKMAEVAIYESALSATRILAHYDAGKIRIRAEDGRRSLLKQNSVASLANLANDDWLLVGNLA